MKKITYLFFLLISCSIFNGHAQDKKAIQLTNNAIVKPTTNHKKELQLTTESQYSLQKTGYVRCASVEMHNRKMGNDAARQQYENAFENWINPLIDARKQKRLLQKANGTFKKAVVTVPVIFHIITSGTGPTNLSQAIVNAQIDQLNLDFSNQGGVGGASSTHPAAADAEIVFVPALVDPNGNILAEPGIDRVTTFGAGPFPTSDFDLGDGGLEIKPATIWDRSVYANIWTADLTGGILGYAQFPSNSTLPGFPADGGSELNDGTVMGYGTIGSRDMPGSAAPYNLGRTLTHEIGHWIGLRHIWGDTTGCAGGSTAGDYCADTPDSTSSNFGCPTGTDKCPADGLGDDMIENYMDYTDDACMDIFTADQVSRTATVLLNADGISNLPNSDVASAATVFFVDTTPSVIEGSDCSYTDINIPITLTSNADAAATANFSVSSATATDGVDFQLMTSSLTYASGIIGQQNVVVRIYSDSFVEGDETVTIDFTLNSNGGNAVTGNSNSVTLTISDDDTLPTTGSSSTLFTSTSDDTTGWTLIDGDGGTTWGIFGAGIDYPGVITPNFFGSRAEDATTNDYIISPEFTIPADATTITLTHGLTGFGSAQTYELYFADVTDEASILAGTLLDSGTSAVGDPGGLTTINIPLSVAGSTGSLALRHTANSANNGYLLWDTMTVTSTSIASIQTAVNTATTNDQLNLPGTGTVYTADTSGDLMLDIVNNNADDYGCTTIAVSRAGTGAQSYNGSISPAYVTDKTFTITPTNTVTNGNVDITFYFNDSDAAELAGWEGLGNSRANLFAYREGSNDIVPLSVAAFGTNITLTGTFTGLDGTYYFGTESAFRTFVSPKVFLQGAAVNPNVGEETLMRDDLRVAGLIPTTSPYADALTCNATVFNTTGANAIVDWVWIELRDATDNTIIVASQSALLQRDGDVVSVDGTSSLIFNTTSKAYYVSISHRNHMSIMSATTLALTDGIGLTDFTSTVTAIGTNPQTTNNMPAGISGMWAGNVNGDAQIRYQGSGNDSVAIKDTALAQAGNTSASNLYQFTAYNTGDVDMNGTIRYQGSNNDTNILKDLIIAHPENGINSNLFLITKQF